MTRTSRLRAAFIFATKRLTTGGWASSARLIRSTSRSFEVLILSRIRRLSLRTISHLRSAAASSQWRFLNSSHILPCTPAGQTRSRQRRSPRPSSSSAQGQGWRAVSLASATASRRVTAAWSPASQPSRPGPSDWFSGTVRIDPAFSIARACTRWRGAGNVRAGRAHCVAHASARSNTHRHCGLGWVRRDGGLSRKFVRGT
jgi:hypothetical protein